MSNNIYYNQASKIFIYNTTEEVPSKANSLDDDSDEHMEPKNTSSITILTSGIPEYHIRIKNSFKSELIKSNNEVLNDMKSNSSDEISSTFSINEDVLMKTGDDKLYLGTVIGIKSGKYLIKFDDNTEKWAPSIGLKKLNSSIHKSDDDPLCVVCKIKDDNDVVEVCNKCSRGYHRHCIKNSPNFSSPWCCDRCTASEIISISDSEDNERDETEEGLQNFKLPYNIKSLNWCAQHRENKEHTYCYCGQTGTWNRRMLQCCKCQQWFHEKCINNWDSEKSTLMNGDMFFVFCCKICNEGEEFLRRLLLSWKTAIHLVLYELSLERSQKYYSISKDVVPFMWDKWDQLHFPFEKCYSKEKFARRVLQTVKKEGEFKSFGSSNKKKGDLVYLRRRTPPSLSKKLNFPSGFKVCEKTLKKINVNTFPLNNVVNKINLNVGGKKVELMSTDQPTFPTKERNSRKKSNVSSSKVQTYRSLQLIEATNDDSSDENSSKSTLDWIIPPLSNFYGRNNPFHSQYRSNAKGKIDKNLKKGQKTLPDIRIVRTIKRRLSAKDIALGPNQEAKRRKVMKRRKSCDVEIISEIFQPISMPLPCLPFRNIEAKDLSKNNNGLQSLKDLKNKDNDMSYPVKEVVKASRLKRLCRGKGFESQTRTNSTENYESENQNSVEINVTDAVINSPIKNKSINLYFGALNRIENGENFTILAKRLTFDGKEQYLLEWESSNSNGVKYENH